MSAKPQSDSAVTRLAVVGVGALISSILFSAHHMLLPPAGFVFGLLAPFPLVISRLRYDSWMLGIAILAATAILMAGFGAQAGGLFLVQCGVIALLLPELLMRGYGAARSLTWTVAVNLVVYLLATLLMIYVSGRSVQQLHDLAVSEINTSIAQAVVVYEKAGIKADELAAVKSGMTAVGNLVIKIYPALATIMLIAMSGCNLVLIKRFALRIGLKLKIGEFRNFRNPELLIWPLIVAGFAMLSNMATVTIPALNVLAVLGVLYFLQGMAVISSMFYRLGSSAVLKVALYLLLFVQPYTIALVTAIGIFDLWGDFRTPRKQENL